MRSAVTTSFKRPAEHPSVSVVIPMWNCKMTIAATLRALAAQTLQPDELVLVDDSSTDDTYEAARAVCAEQLPAYVVLTHEQPSRLGPAAARNAGAALATGELLCFLDSDASPDPQWLERLVDTIHNSESVMAAYGRYRYRETHAEPIWQQLFIEAQQRHERRYQTAQSLPDTRGFVIRKKAFDDLGGFNPTFDRPGREDVEFAVRLVQQYGKEAAALAPNVGVVHELPPTFAVVWRKYYHQGRGVILAHQIASIPYTSAKRSFAHALRQRGLARIAYFASTAFARALGMTVESLRISLRNIQP